MNNKRILWIAGISLFVVAFDQITKTIAQETLRGRMAKIYWNDFFRFQYAENNGGMLGFGSGLPDEIRFIGLTILPSLLLVALLAYLIFNRHLTMLQTVALSAIFGGGLSNILDRILNSGLVVDFMNMGIGSVRTGIFNVADVAIMCGLGLMLLFGGWRDAVPSGDESTDSADKAVPGEAGKNSQ